MSDLDFGGDSEVRSSLAKRLRSRILGDVRFDRLARTLYSTDASIYEIIPAGVVIPKTVDDVVETVHGCREVGIPIIARGGGTGLTGGAVGCGVQLDLSRYLTGISPVDIDRQTVDVEAGVVLDELNAELRAKGLMFAPDVATGNRATIGGMIANNSCGARSIRYGRTVDHVAKITAVLSDGEVVTFGGSAAPGSTGVIEGRDRATRIERTLASIRDQHYSEIQKRFPKVLRSNGGYGLDRLGPPGSGADPIKVICGSEGTLAIVVGAKLRLTPIPNHVGMVVVLFERMPDALAATPAILRHDPVAVELIDRMIVEAGRRSTGLVKACDFLTGDPGGVLAVEFEDETANGLAERMDALAADSDATCGSYAVVKLSDTDRQSAFWTLRKNGLGLLMSKPGDAQPHAFVEDSAVDPARLREYIDRFSQVLDKEGVEAGYYAHASVGCIHVRPVLNLRCADDVAKMRRIAEAVCDLAVEFSGAMTGEHGDGLLRSCWIERVYGAQLVRAFREVKNVFDPTGLFNPNKIVDPLPMTEHLRQGAALETVTIKTHLDFSAHGGPAGMAQMCSGVGECRKRIAGTMCPSYQATHDETHTTRARANALRIALSNRGLLDGLDDDALDEVMDLCISCKACQTECPTGVDMARLKAEYLSRRNMTRGASGRARLIASTPERLVKASRFPRLSNAVLQSGIVRSFMQWRYGLDRRVAPPRLARQTFRTWFRSHLKSRGSRRDAPRGPIIYFLDTWTNTITPQVGIAAVRLLEAAGYQVLCPPLACCGRPAISQGLLSEAKELAARNVKHLTRIAADDVPIVGTEPSCLLTLVDEYPQLVRSSAASRIADRCVLMDSLLVRLLAAEPDALRFRSPRQPLRFHAHCHQQAIVGTHDASALLSRVWGERATTLDAGCCGMAGAFGHEVEHYDVARAIGEDRLFPAVRDRGESSIAVSGFSCRHQIAHHTGIAPRHLVEHLADLLE